MAEARLELATSDDLLKEQLNTTPESVLQAAGENVTAAIVAPSSPNSHFVIGLFLLVGLMFGVRNCPLARAKPLVGGIFPVLCRPLCLRVIFIHHRISRGVFARSSTRQRPFLTWKVSARREGALHSTPRSLSNDQKVSLVEPRPSGLATGTASNNPAILSRHKLL